MVRALASPMACWSGGTPSIALRSALVHRRGRDIFHHDDQAVYPQDPDGRVQAPHLAIRVLGRGIQTPYSLACMLFEDEARHGR